MSPSKLLITAAALSIVLATPVLYAETLEGAEEVAPAPADVDPPASCYCGVRPQG